MAYNVVVMRLNRGPLASNICHPCPNLPNMKITPRGKVYQHRHVREGHDLAAAAPKPWTAKRLPGGGP